MGRRFGLTGVFTAVLALGLCGAPMAEEAGSAVSFSLEIPEVRGVGSSIDDETLLAILSGGIEAHAEALAQLTAESISVPSIGFSISEDGEEVASFVYRDLVLTDVEAGVAGSVSVASASTAFGHLYEAELGEMSAREFNIGGLLGFYGLVPGLDTEVFQEIYRDLRFEGGRLTGERLSCRIGAASAGGFSARPMDISIFEIIGLAQEMEAAGDAEPDPQMLARVIAFYTEMFTSMAAEESRLEGLDCKGIDNDGAPVSFGIGPITVGAMEPGLYPSVSVEDVSLLVDGASETIAMNYDRLVLKGFSYGDLIETLRAMPMPPDDAWLEENISQLFPAFEGFGFSGFEIAVRDHLLGEDFSFFLGDFDLTLANHLGAIPTEITSHADKIVIPLPEPAEGIEDEFAVLRGLGIEVLDLSYRLALGWDGEARRLVLDPVTITLAEFGEVSVSATLDNVTPELFSGDDETMAAAAMALLVSEVSVSLSDDGGVELFLVQAGEDMGLTGEEVRPLIAANVEGAVAAMFLGSGVNTDLGQAVGAFIREGRDFSVRVTPRKAGGISLAELAMAEDDPFGLMRMLVFEVEGR